MGSWSLSYWTTREVPDPVHFHWWDRDSSRALQSLWQPLHLTWCVVHNNQKQWFQGQVTFHGAPLCVSPGDFVLGAGFSQALMFSKLNQGFFFVCLFFNYLFIYFGCPGSSLLWGLFSGGGEQGLFFVVVLGLLIAVASLVAEHRL